ncbi:WD40 domain-containing protein [Aliterella atlantica]|uniref:Novel STAND NTPase 1 domain-containing protein n=1 Tax=Aliterella atlantica CENA595 TaxID=1618023 RepID=A0A0D8ZV99_9CYAN|nr:hypothetical protein [Aliterella atlantica]KJH72389.1 hypothetical protein UH38_06310 [Aliterella atlantica CENA595]
MSKLRQSEDITAYNQESLEALIQAIDLSQGQFTLILIRCNYASVREQIIYQLQKQCPVRIESLALQKSVRTLYSTIKTSLSDRTPAALMVRGLESVSAIEQVLVATNQVREEFRKIFPFPLLIWVTDEVLQKMIRLAPDFESWATTYEFAIATKELISFLVQTTDEVFAKVLEMGAGKFLDNAALNLEIGSSRRFQLESAWRDLQARGINLQPELAASLEFVLGRDASSSMEQSLQHYERSLAFWQQSSNLERKGCLLFSIGLWWRTYAVLHRAQYDRACTKAKEYYQQCIATFEQANRPDLQAKFINALGDVLQKLKLWNELEIVAGQALNLHKIDSDAVRLAYAYGLLAEVALAKTDWTQAHLSAQEALQILANAQYVQSTRTEDDNSSLNRANTYHRGWYVLLLAIAQQHLGNIASAIQNLKTAKAETKPQHDPQLYIRILETLRALYFNAGKYLEAFTLKQEQRSIEQQYGFRAFIGAGQLQPQGQVINLALVPSDRQATVAQIIAASGRQPDVEALLVRMSSHDNALTILHGQSGVGKSSLIDAGLVPVLKERGVGEQSALPIVLRNYTDWEQELGQNLVEALAENWNNINISTQINTSKKILEQLQQNRQYNIKTIFIFDQFAQLFFVKQQAERKPFWEFLRDCLNTSAVKVIIAIREDYLYYLLEAERLTANNGTRNAILKDILSKNNRYSLGNFSTTEAKEIIQKLTARSQFDLEPDLVEEMVKDLGKSGEVRPIELQVVGAQLQTDNIQTLEKYRQFGPKEKLVQRFLAEVVKDCGSPNEDIAQLVLYLLTDEKLTRPLRTRNELISEANKILNDLADKETELELILNIFVASGLVSLLQEVHIQRYQLVHDYLISFIRQQSEKGLIAKIKEEQRKSKLIEKQYRQLQKWIFAALFAVPMTIVIGILAYRATVLAYKATINARQAEIAKTNALITSSKALLNSNQEFDALVSGLQAVQGLKSDRTQQQTEVKEVIQQALYQVRERNRLEGHSDVVFGTIFSPDGQTIVSVSGDKTVKLWRRDGTLIKTLIGHNDSVVDASFSPDGRMLATASYDRTIKLWRRDGTLLTTLSGHKDQIWHVNFSPDGQIIASASRDKTVKLWRRDGTLITTLTGHQGWVGRVSFSPDNQQIASASSDKTVKLWRRNGTLITTLKGHTSTVLDVVFSPDGQIIASASSDNTVRLWRRNGTLLTTLKGHNAEVYRVSFSPNSQLIASASADNTVKLWQRNGKLFNTLRGHSAEVYRVNFSPDGQSVASASADKTVKLWRRSGTLLATLTGHKDSVIDISFSPDGNTLASASYDKTVKLWQLRGTYGTYLIGHINGVYSTSFSPDGQQIASASADDTIKLWQRDGTLLRTISGNSNGVYSISFSPDGSAIASASLDNTIKLWRRNGDLFKTLAGHSNSVYDVSFSPDSQIFASASADNTVRLWRRDGTLLKTLTGHQDIVYGVSFSPDGQIVASASLDDTIKIWRRDGTLIKTIAGNSNGVYDVSFSPDGQIIASASGYGTVKLWRSDGTLFKTLVGHKNSVFRVSFSPDGQKIASASGDGTVKIWRRDGTLLTTLIGHKAGVIDVSFAPDSKSVASASNDNTVIVWTLLDDLVVSSCNWLRDYLKTEGNDSLCSK